MANINKNLELIARDNKIKEMFKDYINGDFLIEILDSVSQELGWDLFKYFDMRLDQEHIISGHNDRPEYEICWHIVGIHESNTLFVEDKSSRENDEQYKKQLIDDVIFQIHNRMSTSYFFRSKTLIESERFAFYPVPYVLFYICLRGLRLLSAKPKFINFYINIFNKSLAAISLMELHYLDSVYPICRGVIELYWKYMLIRMYPEVYLEEEEFVGYEIDKNCCHKEKFDPKFIEKFNNRLHKNDKDLIHYLHYGWVDKIKDYDFSVKNPYSINAIFRFLAKKNKNSEKYFYNLNYFYKICHPYIHGNVGNIKFNVLYYLENSILLCQILKPTFENLFKDANIQQTEQDKSMLKYLDKHFEHLKQQYEKRSTSLFKQYYKKHK